MTTLTRDERQLLTAVIRHIRASGWQLFPGGRARHRGAHLAADWAYEWTADGKTGRNLQIRLTDRNGFTERVCLEADVTSVREAVDVIVAFGMLPKDMSSMYRAAVDAADAVLAALTPAGPAGVLAEVAAERAAQDEKWGEQNHPDADPAILRRLGKDERFGTPRMVAERLAMEYEIPTAARAKYVCQTEADRGGSTWIGIAVEELAEALEATVAGPAALRTELVQTAAVVIAWIEALDRRHAQAAGRG